jgi:hypothetical protein
MRNALAATVVVCAMLGCQNAGAEESDAVAAKMLADPVVGPLLSCYQDDYDNNLSIIAKSVSNERKYHLAVISNGGFFGIARFTVDQCNKWYIKQYPDVPNSSDLTMEWGELFQDWAKDHDATFKNLCLGRAEKEDDWRFMKNICKRIRWSYK